MDRMNLVDYLKTIPKPTPTESGEKEKLKIFLVTARKSSRIGLLLIGLPSLLISLFILQALSHFKLGFIQWLGGNTFSFPTPVKAMLIFVFLVGFPMIAMVLNLLSLSHFQFDERSREFRITFRIRWWNIVIALAGGALATFYILHILADTLLGGR
ncbi:MAG TPA: hypothetical protein VNV35_16575 [Puia sp.]|jgi:hypothetical protein|nr:hypothetical protein [Puia sp.]